ncbi:cell wall-binding repeat-containing protein [Herbiconiux moechotypicola]|uniref:Cell wall-binding repeat-containing protein n=1 Tax=Herbiconiux moechotypicola TaxID=637393 RepID=A0ABP5Q1P0_9MICO|nr:cell wall-binding repeat-containing protein [Herbiconiux moechotypicola]MCS5728386.1 cell wall-binding repeat-containing protein [Herbiconiux moechotypicola]
MGRALRAALAVTMTVAAAVPFGLGSAAAGADELAPPVVSRVSGADRYELAATLAVQSRPAGADIVYVASGESYPDALSAGPAAVHGRGALLLVRADAVPTAAVSALATLRPPRIVVVGGPASVSPAVLTELQRLAPAASVTRISGADRYEVSRTVATTAFAPGLAETFVATGRNFPDALTVGAAAGLLDSPVVLVDGALPGVDIPTVRSLDQLRTSRITLVGGTSSVSATAEFSLGLTHSVRRIDGPDRYTVSQNINTTIPASFETVYLVTGENFPDALAGGVLAGTRHRPMYIVPRDCVPAPVLATITTNRPDRVVLLGGPASLGDGVARLEACS